LIELTPGNLSFGTGFEVGTWLGRNRGPEQQLYALNLFPLLALRGLWRLGRTRILAGSEISAEPGAGGKSAGSAA
jgi:hypothetical protein